LNLEGEPQAIAYADQVLSTGPSPQDWDTRSFLPRSALQSLTGLFVGLEFTSRPGDRDSAGHYDGASVSRLDSISLLSDRGRLRPKIEATIRYEPDRQQPWWANATAKISLEADFLPVANPDGDTLRVRIVPLSVGFLASWNPFAISTNAFISKAIASQVIESFSDKLFLDVPPLTAKRDLPLKLDQRSHGSFPEGGYDLVVKLNGPTFMGALSTSYIRVTDTGIWLLGGRQPSFSSPPALPPDIEAARQEISRRREGLQSRLPPLDSKQDLVELRVPSRTILDLARQISGPPGKPTVY
jgi:hypothetical protein